MGLRRDARRRKTIGQGFSDGVARYREDHGTCGCHERIQVRPYDERKQQAYVVGQCSIEGESRGAVG
jgi:hypothetical protein